MTRLYMMLLMAMMGISAIATEPIRLQGVMPLDSMPEMADYVQLHVRAFPAEAGKSHWGLRWNVRDSLNCCAASVHTAKRVPGNEVYSQKAEIAVYAIRDGVEERLAEHTLTLNDDCLSLKLIYDGFSARLYAGDGVQHLIDEVPYNPAVNVAEVSADTPIGIVRLTALAFGAPAPGRSQWDSVEQLCGYLEGSSDPMERVWTYLDRDISADKASLGGKYAIATVKNNKGGYDILYLGGAEQNAAAWQPLMVKGVMAPTIFNGNYDAVWVDAHGHVLDDDVYASVSADGAILSICLPVIASQLRFSLNP